MRYDPERHDRQSMRWETHDYRQPGVYFVTICTHDRACVLGRVEDDRVRLSPVGRVARNCWVAIPDHFPHADLDVYVIMPNHVHGLVVIRHPTDSTGGDTDGRDTKFRVPTPHDWGSNSSHSPHSRAFGKSVAGSLSRIIGAYKAAVTRQVRRSLIPDFRWQRNFHDRVVRDAEELERIRWYIAHNPAQWTRDRNHPRRMKEE